MAQEIKALLESKNIAESLDKELLQKIGQDAKRGFESDLLSRKEWEVATEEWTKLAKQLAEVKTYPWRNASNVKYPLLSTAAMQFAARAYPSLVPSDRKIVKGRPIGKDPTGQKTKSAEAVALYMSYQLMDEMKGWEEDMDKLLLMLPIVGVMFKKTYWDSVKKVNCSRLVLPKNLVVDYWTTTLDEAERISEILQLSKRKVQERKQAGLWLEDVELGDPTTPVDSKNAPISDNITPYEFIEQHCYLDLDDDDYEEPYIVTFQRTSGKVVRITARFDQDTITMDDKGEMVKIEAVQYYTKFGFIPSPDGGFYDNGFGTLLGPLNESVNTLINQLIGRETLQTKGVSGTGEGRHTTVRRELIVLEGGERGGELGGVHRRGGGLQGAVVREPGRGLAQQGGPSRGSLRGRARARRRGRSRSVRRRARAGPHAGTTCWDAAGAARGTRPGVTCDRLRTRVSDPRSRADRLTRMEFLYNVFVSYRRGQKAPGDDPWGYGNSLEWATSCPPPRHNFVSIPRIRSESPAFDLHHPEVAALEMEQNEALGQTDLVDAPDVEGREEAIGGGPETKKDDN